ncbi:hypothetical protein ACFZCP_14400 [Streptomyces sp. NPDC007971]|uniref:hypothetical protein n=1 Tax=Streptomyces sp. NPDC007971 TaxID=3364799 RepID=UPI0036E7A086
MSTWPSSWACDASVGYESGGAAGASVRCDRSGRPMGHVVVVRFERDVAGSPYYEVANVLATAMRAFCAGAQAPLIYGDLDGVGRGLRTLRSWGPAGYPDRVPMELRRLLEVLGPAVERIQYERVPRNSTEAMALVDRSARSAMRGRNVRGDVCETSCAVVVESYERLVLKR